jgi:hypothetical protein
MQPSVTTHFITRVLIDASIPSFSPQSLTRSDNPYILASWPVGQSPRRDGRFEALDDEGAANQFEWGGFERGRRCRFFIIEGRFLGQ